MAEAAQEEKDMFRKSVSRVMWMARGTATMLGLAVMFAVVLGVGTTALAAVPGDPFKLGRTNTINNAFTRLLGSNAGDAMLKVDNDSSAAGSRALDLRVEPGKEPTNVNADAGKATNLDADEVDGKGADQIGVNGLERVSETSDNNSASGKFAFAECPEGKVVVGTGYALNGFAIGTGPDLQTSVVMDEVRSTTDSQVLASAVEEEPFAGNWSVQAQAICATEGTP